MKSSGICHIGCVKDLTDHTEKHIHLRIHYLALDTKEGSVLIHRICTVKNFNAAGNSTGLGIDLIGKLSISVMCGIYISKHGFKESQIWNFIRCKVLEVKHQIQIGNSIC